MSIKSRQVAGVTTLVVVIVAVVSAGYLATLARLSLQETEARGDMLRQQIFQRAREVVTSSTDPYAALRQDSGIRLLLESAAAYSPNVNYAAIVDKDGVAVVHNFPTQEGQHLADQEELAALVKRRAVKMLRAVDSDRTLETRQPLLLNGQDFGSIRIGILTLLVKE